MIQTSLIQKPSRRIGNQTNRRIVQTWSSRVDIRPNPKGANIVRLIFSVTNRAILRSGEDVQGNRYAIECVVSDLPTNVRRLLADRLFNDAFVCEGVLNEASTVEPRLGEYGEPILLQVDGTDLRDLVEAIRQDQREVDESLAEARSAKN